MTIHQAAAYLICFDAPPPSPPVARGDNDDAPAPVVEALFPSPPPSDPPPPEPQRSEEEIYAVAEAKFSEMLEAERKAFERRLRDERARWVGEQAGALSRQLARALDDALESLRADVARVLFPFLSREIADHALSDLIAAVRQGLTYESAAAVTVKAPKDLLERITAALEAENIAITARESDEIDAHVAFSSTLVETRLGDWIGRLSSAKDESR